MKEVAGRGFCANAAGLPSKVDARLCSSAGAQCEGSGEPGVPAQMLLACPVEVMRLGSSAGLGVEVSTSRVHAASVVTEQAVRQACQCAPEQPHPEQGKPLLADTRQMCNSGSTGSQPAWCKATLAVCRCASAECWRRDTLLSSTSRLLAYCRRSSAQPLLPKGSMACHTLAQRCDSGLGLLVEASPAGVAGMHAGKATAIL